MTNTEQIEYSVACFQQGDLEAVLGPMAEEVDFRPSGPAELLPWARPRYGRAEVAQYFDDLLEDIIDQDEVADDGGSFAEASLVGH